MTNKSVYSLEVFSSEATVIDLFAILLVLLVGHWSEFRDLKENLILLR